MERMTAFCGLNCAECLTYLATMKNDENEREKVALLWTKQFNHVFKPEDINCMGCTSNSGTLFSHCRICEVRKCGIKNGYANCAYCADYPCAKVAFIINNVPSAKAVLDEIQKSLKLNI